MVPTSDSARGESTFPITSVLPVELPGFKTDDPLSTDTSTSFPANVAAPTSTFLSVGSPMRISFPDFGMKRSDSKSHESSFRVCFGMTVGAGYGSAKAVEGLVNKTGTSGRAIFASRAC